MAAVADFVIARTFDAPRDLVWSVWTDPEHMKHWWGPKGFTARVAKMELRPGGINLYCLTAPDGSQMWGRFVYREIIKPEKIVLINSLSDAEGGLSRHPMSPTWPMELLTTFEFTEVNGKTTVTVRWSPHNSTSEEIAAFDAGRQSMTGGWTGTFDQCIGYIATLKGTQS